MSSRDALTALRRFGLGPRPGEVARVSADPRGFVLAQLSQPRAARLDDPDLDPSHVVFAETRRAQREKMAARKALEAAAPAGAPSGPEPAPPAARPNRIRMEALHEERAAKAARLMATHTPFLERLVSFWSNHFTVSLAKGQVRGLVGAYEREAIRPHVLGRFAAMLKAVEQHPAMLIYLDNAMSIGPNSKAGNRREKGLNENLAREILELHTLGVGGGYSQADVTNLARLLTGWTVGGLLQDAVEPGRFHFTPHRHEPGAWNVAGRTYESGGIAVGERCLEDLARHPATARHVAAKLARHFTHDDPPPALVALLERTFRDTDGDLGAVTRALVSAPEAWQAPCRKIVSPLDYVVSIARGFGLTPAPGEVIRLSGVLGQPVWEAPSPKGWPDDDGAWIGPSPLRERLRIAEQMVRGIDRSLDPRAAAEDILGATLGAPTRQAIARAESREQGFQLLMMSPEFMRR